MQLVSVNQLLRINRKAQQAQYFWLDEAEHMAATRAAQTTVADRQQGAEYVPPAIG